VNKRWWWLLIMILPCLSQAEDLSEKKKRIFIKAIDLICGDVWCSSDDEYQFDTINCKFENKTCLVEYHKNNKEDTCRINNVSNVVDLIHDDYPIDQNTMWSFHQCFDKNKKS